MYLGHMIPEAMGIGLELELESSTLTDFLHELRAYPSSLSIKPKSDYKVQE